MKNGMALQLNLSGSFSSIVLKYSRIFFFVHQSEDAGIME